MSKKSLKKALAAQKKAAQGKPVSAAQKGTENQVTPGKSVKAKASTPVFIAPNARPFEGFDHEVEIAAMRELIPAASLQVRTTKQYGDKDVLFVTLAPDQAQGVVTKSGRILVGLQTNASSQDVSHDVALVLSKLLEAKEPVALSGVDVRQEAPALRDMIASEGAFEIHDDFGFWFDSGEDITPQIREALDSSARAMVATKPVEGVRGAFWCQMNHQFVRWVRAEDETAVLHGLARLLADGQCVLTPGSRCIGAFRMLGLLTPVWQLDDDTDFDELSKAVRDFDAKLSEAIADDTPLTPQQRRARDGFISRQVSLR